MDNRLVSLIRQYADASGASTIKSVFFAYRRLYGEWDKSIHGTMIQYFRLSPKFDFIPVAKGRHKVRVYDATTILRSPRLRRKDRASVLLVDVNCAEFQPVVINHGSYLTQCGFGGDDSPRAVFPTVTGRPKYPGMMLSDGGIGMGFTDCVVGDMAIMKQGICRMNWPFEKGLITSWNDAEKVWHHVFYNELRVDPEDGNPVLLTNIDPSQRERVMVTMFESFNAIGIAFAGSGKLSLLANGEMTGVSLQIQDDLSTAVSVYSGHEIACSSQKSEVGSEQLVKHLQSFLGDLGYEMRTGPEEQIVRNVVQNLCYVSMDFDVEMTKFEATGDPDIEFELPDGSQMSIGSGAFQTPEMLFRPQIAGLEGQGIGELVKKSISATDNALSGTFFSKIFVCGQNAQMEGLHERLKKEVVGLTPPDTRVEIIPNQTGDDPRFLVWNGGSLMSVMSSMSWASKEQYDDCGGTLVHRAFY